MHQFGIREKKFYTAMNQHTQPDRTTPLQSVWSMAVSDVTIECERFIYSLKFMYTSI